MCNAFVIIVRCIYTTYNVHRTLYVHVCENERVREYVCVYAYIMTFSECRSLYVVHCTSYTLRTDAVQCTHTYTTCTVPTCNLHSVRTYTLRTYNFNIF